MIRPARFGANPETAASNAFQRARTRGGPELLERALSEFDGLVDALQANGVEVVVVDDTPEPEKPDAVFPNNWVPAPCRWDCRALSYARAEPARGGAPSTCSRSPSAAVCRGGAARSTCARRCRRGFLEGHGGLVLDRASRAAYTRVSPRTSERDAREVRPRARPGRGLRAFDARGIALYHTNVMMSVGTAVAVVCLESIRDPGERERVRDRLAASGRELVALTLAQVDEFAGNLLELRSRSGEALFVLSTRARRALGPDQARVLERHGRLVSAGLDTIETHGGGSARCMIAEVF